MFRKELTQSKHSEPNAHIDCSAVIQKAVALPHYEDAADHNWYELAALEDELCRVVEVTQG